MRYAMNINFSDKKIFFGAAALLLLLAAADFFHALTPVSGQNNAPAAVFEIRPGTGFREISGDLSRAGLVRSAFTFDIFLLVSGRAWRLKPGIYQLNPSMPAAAIAVEIVDSANSEVTVTIPEGSDIYDINEILSKAFIIHRGDLIGFRDEGNLEGRLFPDTYKFFTGTAVSAVVRKFFDNWNAKVRPILGRDESGCISDAICKKNLILASLIEKEVPDQRDRRIVAGILIKRLSAGMRLQVDATACFAKKALAPLSDAGCYPLDLKIDSPYNSYLHGGLPPGPIGNPGVSSIEAATQPESSPYWFYISDPKTKKTIFAKTLQEQDRNAAIFLK